MQERQAFSQAIVNARTPASVLKLHNGELMGRVADQRLQLFRGYPQRIVDHMSKSAVRKHSEIRLAALLLKH